MKSQGREDEKVVMGADSTDVSRRGGIASVVSGNWAHIESYTVSLPVCTRDIERLQLNEYS